MAPKTSTDPPTTQKQFISFLLTQKVWGMVQTSQLTETINLELGKIVQIPDLPPAVVGVCGWRGEVLWLVDLSYALGLAPLLSADYQSDKCNVLKVTVNQQSFGILVAEVRQLMRCDPQDIQTGLPVPFKAEVAPLIAGHLTTTGNIQVTSFNLEALLETLRSPT
ncbi:chemotaxis protein CheW [[Limnothrix rosea] IAM M-220]|uniref:chemotaxis protein CheW n=1 Tax=[Limnothrix rosea] IAM M-220 TaxID=454133 RepID=UPI000961DEB5|nr:chemotaxis protein CheW [[Limnothrix rosea] IAM M-220]OKH19753.1 chemotaxis protein CheW [[Limnothrix rosea] IAM M-220]